MLFFIREDEQNENRNKMTSYNKKNITIDIDQDPINHLVFDASNFSSQLRYPQLQTELTTASENYLHATDIRRPTFFSSSTEVFIEEMRRWHVK